MFHPLSFAALRNFINFAASGVSLYLNYRGPIIRLYIILTFVIKYLLNYGFRFCLFQTASGVAAHI